MIGIAVLLVLAVAGAWMVIHDSDPDGVIFALTSGYLAYAVARGFDDDEDEDERRDGGSPHDAI